MLVTQRTRAMPGHVHQHLGRLQVFVPRRTGHQAGRRRAYLRRRGRVSGRDGRVFAPVHKHGGLRVLRVSRRIAAGQRLENMRGRRRVLGSGNATVTGSVRRPRHGVPKHVRLVQMHVTRPCAADHATSHKGSRVGRAGRSEPTHGTYNIHALTIYIPGYIIYTKTV